MSLGYDATAMIDDRGTDDGPGEVIDGRFRLRGLLGEGAMGLVYAADDLRAGARVAVKLLLPELRSQRRYCDRFEREAMVTARIQHPHCAQVKHFGRAADVGLYLAMELLEGRSLADLIDTEHVVRERRALRIMRQILDGLGAAHEAGIVHRDLKPENIFLHQVGADHEHVKLLDFGIAKLIGEADEGQAQLTSVGLILGTPAYIAPEWMTSDDVDGRADLYAATIVLYEMLAGQPPFYSENKAEIMRMHRKGERPRVSDLAPSVRVSPRLEEVIARGLAVDPDDRFADAAEYGRVIDELCAAQARPGRRESTWTPPQVAELAAQATAPRPQQVSARVPQPPPQSAPPPHQASPPRQTGRHSAPPFPAAAPPPHPASPPRQTGRHSAPPFPAAAPSPHPAAPPNQTGRQTAPPFPAAAPPHQAPPPRQTGRHSAPPLPSPSARPVTSSSAPPPWRAPAPGSPAVSAPPRPHLPPPPRLPDPRGTSIHRPSRRLAWIAAAAAVLLVGVGVSIDSGSSRAVDRLVDPSSAVDAWRDAGLIVTGFDGKGSMHSLTVGRCDSGEVAGLPTMLCAEDTDTDSLTVAGGGGDDGVAARVRQIHSDLHGD